MLGQDSGAALKLYEQLAREYDLLFEDWQESVVSQGRVLDRLLRATLGDRSLSILDCACGIGTQAIGLALAGHRVVGSDLSPTAVSRARDEAASFGVEIPFVAADLLHLSDRIHDSFDVVLACDNALPHLLEDSELRRAAAQMFGRLNAGGALLVSLRDYDKLRLARPDVTEPRLMDGPDGRRLVMQIWSWAADGKTYEFDLLILKDRPGGWSTQAYRGRYRVLLRKDLERFLRQAGFATLEWYDPEDSGYYQPILIARKARSDD